MSEKKRTHFRLPRDVAVGAILAAGKRSLDGLRAARCGSGEIDGALRQWANASAEQLAGRFAEAHHAVTFNVDAAKKASPLRAMTGLANGTATAAADVVVTGGSRPVEVQVKYCGSAARTTGAVAQRKYDGMQRIVPEDQVEKVRELARKRGIDGLGQRNYPAVADEASNRIRVDNVESKPLSRLEALEAAMNPEGVAGKIVRQEMLSAVSSAAIAGAMFGGAIAGVSSAMAFRRGDKSGTEAVADTLKGAAGSAVLGAAVSVTTVAVEVTLVRTGARALLHGSAPAAIGLTAVEVAGDLGRLVTGRIEAAEFTGRAGGTVLRASATWAAAEAGALIGTAILPGPGTVVGGVVGGIAGSLAGGWLASAARSIRSLDRARQSLENVCAGLQLPDRSAVV